MKQSDIKIATHLIEQIQKLERDLDGLTNFKENISSSIDFQIHLARASNNYNNRTSMLSTGIKDAIRSLVVADLQAQVQFMKKKIENL